MKTDKKIEYLKTKIDLEASKYLDKDTEVTRVLQRKDGFYKHLTFNKNGITRGDIWELEKHTYRYALPPRFDIAVDQLSPYNDHSILDFYPKNIEVKESKRKLKITVWYEEI